jgi:hypothetical protein
MPKLTETQWKARLRKQLAKFGPVLSLHGHAMQEPGWPDIYVASSRWSGFIELKMATGQLSTAQKIVGRRLEAHGVFVVLRYIDEQWAAVDTADGGHCGVVTWTHTERLLAFISEVVQNQRESS